MKHLFLLVFIGLSLITGPLYAQVSIGALTPDPSAQLDVVSPNKGVLVSRVVSTSLVNNPAQGLLVYQTSNPQGFYYYDGAAWQKVGKETFPPSTTHAFATNNKPFSTTLSSSGYLFNFDFITLTSSTPTSGITFNADYTGFNLTAAGHYAISYNLALTVGAQATEGFYTDLLVNGVPATGSQADSQTNGATRFSLTNFILVANEPVTVNLRFIGPVGSSLSSSKYRTLSIVRLK